MRAVTLPSYGDTSVLTLADVPDPVPGDGEVLVDVAAHAGTLHHSEPVLQAAAVKDVVVEVVGRYGGELNVV